MSQDHTPLSSPGLCALGLPFMWAHGCGQSVGLAGTPVQLTDEPYICRGC